MFFPVNRDTGKSVQCLPVNKDMGTGIKIQIQVSVCNVYL